METVITRDTDILREYLAALDARERGLSPFARLAATVKLAQLRRELDTTHIEASDSDIAALRGEIDERLNRTMARRFESRRWGARISIILMLVLGAQLALAIVWLATRLFVSLAPVPRLWNPVLPHEQPVFLFVFIFVFFFMTPMLALIMLFGGRYFRSWRRTLPATLGIIVLAALATFLVVNNKESNNPVRHRTSLEELASQKKMNPTNYRQWVEENWLLKDPKFQRDYETYLRNGPGRWITSRFNANDDAAWRGSISIMGDYMDKGADQEGLREWLAYYMDRNRIYSEDRIPQEVEKIAGSNPQYVGVFQVEPFLKERDQRLYRAYLGSINTSMKMWGIALLALFALVFLIIYLSGPLMSFWERAVAGAPKRPASNQFTADANAPPTVAPPRVRERYYFPERGEITTPSFFDTPLRVLSRVHRSFVRLVVFTSIFVFAFWMFVYAMDIASGNENAPSQVALMRSNLLFGGSPDRAENDGAALVEVHSLSARPSTTYSSTLSPMPDAGTRNELARARGERREELLANHVMGLEERASEDEYQTTKRFKEQYETLEAHNQSIEGNRSEIASLRSQSEQLQLATSTTLPQQIAQATSQSEARASQVAGQAKSQAETVEKQMNEKLRDVESRAANAAEQAGKAEEQARAFQTRSEETKEDIYTNLNELKERTSKLGERMTTIEDREAQLGQIEQLQRVAFAAIMSDLTSGVEDLGRRVNSKFYNLFNKGEATRDAELLRGRIASLRGELEKINTEQSKQMIEQLDQLGVKLEEIIKNIR